jgi:hypothetical protein
MEHAGLHHNFHELLALNLELYIVDDAGGSWEVKHARLLLIPATQSG